MDHWISRQWNNFENRPVFDEVGYKLPWTYFFWPTMYVYFGSMGHRYWPITLVTIPIRWPIWLETHWAMVSSIIYCPHNCEVISWTHIVGLFFRQESQADAGVSAQQSRHLAINYEFGFSTAINALTCAATWRKRWNTDNISSFPQPTLVWRPRSEDPVWISG